MVVTLAQAKVGMTDKVNQQVIDTFRRESLLMDSLVYDDAISKRGTGIAFFHEYGHQIDHKLGWISLKGDLYDLMYEDYLNIKIDYNFLHLINTDDKASSISDLVNGLSGGSIVGAYKHDEKYWTKDDHFSQEMFAHVFEAQFNAYRRSLLEKYFPKAYNYVKELMKGV